jgi:hypothetical protein
VFQRWFTIEWNLEFNAFLHLVAPPGTRAAYLENDDTKTLFEVLLLLDHLCIEEKIVQPAGGQYLMRPRSVDDIPAKTTDGQSIINISKEAGQFHPRETRIGQKSAVRFVRFRLRELRQLG